MVSNEYKGLPASPGMASGSAFQITTIDLVMPEPYISEDTEASWNKIDIAIQNAIQELLRIRSNIEKELGKEEAAIFDAHLMMVRDVALIDMVKTSLKKKINPEAAWNDSIETFASMLEKIPDPTLSARAMDVRDVGQRVLAHLLGKSLDMNVLLVPSIIIARDLTPSQTAMIDHRMVLAFCTAEGGPTSHTAILSKALGIPAIVALGDSVLEIATGELILVDADSGILTRKPSDRQIYNFDIRKNQFSGQRMNDLKSAFEPAVTLDGIHIEVFANIGSSEDARLAMENGAEGVGLFRTEFLYLNRTSLPGIDQQVKLYEQVIQELRGYPLVVRTIDIGGDKKVDYLGITSENNPFLGWRGIRMIFEKPEILRDQFYALLKAAKKTDLRIMLPMVSRIEEVIQARVILDQALESIRKEIPDFEINLQFGIMVEVPSAALMIEHFAPLVDFFSIGTNDLTQYTLAMDRMNSRVAPFATPFHPAVLKLIEQTVRVAHDHGKWVGMCGEFAGEPAAIPFLLGIGLDEFSMSPASIPQAKRIIRQFSVKSCKNISKFALSLARADETEAFLKSKIHQIEK